MATIIAMNKTCFVCGELRPITDFSAYKNSQGVLCYGQICVRCATPIGGELKTQARSKANDSQYAKKVDNYAIQVNLSEHLRAFGEVAPPQEPGDKPSVSSDKQVFSSEGNSYGSEMTGGKAHPILSEAAQFQEAPRNQTPNSADSEQYNKIVAELRLQKELQARLAMQNRVLNTPSKPL